MASRKAQKEAARERRLAEERVRAERDRRTRRMRMVGGVVVVAIAVVAVAIAISSGGSSSAKVVTPNSPAAKKAQAIGQRAAAGHPPAGQHIGLAQRQGDDHRIRRPRLPGLQDVRARRREPADRQRGALRARPRSSTSRSRPRRRPPTPRCSSPVKPPRWPRASRSSAGTTSSSSTTSRATRRRATSATTSSPAWPSRSPGSTTASGARPGNPRRSPRRSPRTCRPLSQRATRAPRRSIVTGPKSQAQPIVGSADYASLQSAIKSVS